MAEMPATISVKEVHARLQRGDALLLLDCREHDEVKVAQIDGAKHIPMGEIPTQQVYLDPDQETIVFCHAGVRSMAVAQFLIEQGFEDVKNMAGGIDAWSQEVDPSVPRY